MGEEGSCRRKYFNLIQSRTSENALLSNKMETILIIEHSAEKSYPNLFSFTLVEMMHQSMLL